MTSCRSCGAEVAGRACEYCGRPVEPDQAVAAPAGLASCPRCPEASSLHRQVVDGAVVHGCRSCHGLWIPKETLEPLVDRGAALTPAEAGGDRPQRLSGDVRYLKCPECDALMARRNYGRVSGVIIDSCPSHGIWLDGGELAALRRFVASGGRKRQERADREKERVEEELRAIRRRPLGGSVLRDVGGWGMGGFDLD